MKKLRKLTALLTMMGLVLSLSACGNAGTATGNDGASQQQESGPAGISEEPGLEEAKEQETADKTLVVYFSATGNTEHVAEIIATVTNADTYEIVPAEPYTDADLNYGDPTSRTSVEMNDPDARPEIGGEDISLDGYQTIYLGYPIWWGDAPRIMNTFVETHDFTDKTVVPFCTSGGSGMGDSGDNLEKQAGSGNWLDGQEFNASSSQEAVRTWIDSLT